MRVIRSRGRGGINTGGCDNKGVDYDIVTLCDYAHFAGPQLQGVMKGGGVLVWGCDIVDGTCRFIASLSCTFGVMPAAAKGVSAEATLPRAAGCCPCNLQQK